MNEKVRVAMLIAELQGDAEILGDLAETNLKADMNYVRFATYFATSTALAWTRNSSESCRTVSHPPYRPSAPRMPDSSPSPRGRGND